VNNQMRIAQEEIFGPSVIPFADEDEAVAIEVPNPFVMR
jgi:acyl-CoA reductase-like NAD-dependent aldehyde dehydrogenase